MVRILGVVVVVMVLPLFAWLLLPAAVLVAVAAVPATPIAIAIAARTSLAGDDSDDDEDEAARRAGRLRRAELRASRRKCRLAVAARRPVLLGSAGPGRPARPRWPWSFPTGP